MMNSIKSARDEHKSYCDYSLTDGAPPREGDVCITRVIDHAKIVNLCPQVGDDADCAIMPTTTFVEETAVCADYSTATLKDDIAVNNQSIVDFMEKPFMLHAPVLWNTTDLRNAVVLGPYNVASYLSSNTLWANKLQGFNMVRGTAHLRVQVNGTPFMQGKLLVHFLPSAPQFALNDPSYVAMHNAKIASKSQQPYAILDVKDSVAVLSVPYITPVNWYDIKHTGYDWGTFYVSVMAPLEVGGSAPQLNVELTVYMYFTDFEMAAPMCPQSGGKPSAR